MMALRASLYRPLALPRSLSHRMRQIGPIKASYKLQDSPQESTTSNNASTSEPVVAKLEPEAPSLAPLAHNDGVMGPRILFGSIFALTIFAWSTSRFFSGLSQSTSSYAQNSVAVTTREAAPKLRGRRLKDSGAPKQPPSAPNKSNPNSTETSSSANDAEKILPASLPLVTVISDPTPSSLETQRPLELSTPVSSTDRDLPLLREKASAALRAAASAADASQKASSHANSSSLAAKKAAEAAQRSSLAASEAQLALEEAAEEAVMAAELRAKQAAALASELEHQALRSSAASTAFNDLAQLQAEIARESAALASSVHRKHSQPPATESPLKSTSPLPLSSSSSSSNALKQHRLSKGFGSDAVAAGGTWLKEVGEGAKESIEGAWKRVSGVKAGSSSLSGSFKNGASGALSLPLASSPSSVHSTTGKQQGNGREIVPTTTVDPPRFPPHS